MDSQSSPSEISGTSEVMESVSQALAGVFEESRSLGEPSNEMLMANLVSNLDKSGEHQWAAGDLVVELKGRMVKRETGGERAMTLQDIFLSIKRRYSVPYLSVLFSVCKMFEGATRAEALAAGATFSDCRDAYRLRQAVPVLKNAPALSVLKEYLSAKDICMTKRETELTEAPATGDKHGSPLNLAIALRDVQAKKTKTPGTPNVGEAKKEYDKAIDDEFSPEQYENATPLQAKFNQRWAHLRAHLAERPRRIEGDGLLIAIELDPRGVPRIAGFDGIGSESNRRLIFGALAHLCRKYVPKAAEVGKIAKEIRAASERAQGRKVLKPTKADSDEKRLRRNQVPSNVSEPSFEEDRK